MSECITVMEGALRGVTDGSSVLPLRTVMRLDGTPNAFAAMPAVVGKGAGASLGAKIITVFPGNDATPYDAHIGVVLLFDAEHGKLLAIADASSITAIRTAAVSGLATRLLAREDAKELALLRRRRTRDDAPRRRMLRAEHSARPRMEPVWWASDGIRGARARGKECGGRRLIERA